MSASPAVVTVAAAMETVIDGCQQRCLTDTATLLGEFLLDATPQLQRQPLSPPTASLLAALRTREGWADGAAASCAMQAEQQPQCHRPRAGVSSPLPEQQEQQSAAAAGGRASRWRGYHRVAVGLFHKAEYQSCHHLLMRAMAEAETTTKKRVRAEVGDGEGAANSTAHTGSNDSDGNVSSSGDTIAASSFATTRLPPALCFLSLYALYMDGQRVKTTSANPPRTRNPHLRVLRPLLLEALRNPHNRLAPPPTTTTAPPPPAPSRGRQEPPQQPEPEPHPDPYLSWLAGVVLRDLGMRQESAAHFIASVRGCPLLWCAWTDMTLLVSREAQLGDIASALGDLEPRFMLEMFLATAKAALDIAPLVAEGTAPVAAIQTVGGGVGGGSTTPPPPPIPVTDPQQQQQFRADGASGRGSPPPASTSSLPRGVATVNSWVWLLRECFPGSLYLRGQLAAFHYRHQKDFAAAEALYTQILSDNPYCLSCVVDFSNLLFILSDRRGLSNLAQRVYQHAPFSAEANFVVGNYYVMLGQHDRSVLHFRRAVAIRPSFSEAWTLLGHAFIETKNSPAAIEAYSTAVELDPRDYRGWYNLGQIYELLQAYHHALYYYWRTASLRPTDPRMWAAVANCLEQDGRTRESVACLERALAYEHSGSGTYPAMARRVAAHYVESQDFARACVFLDRLVSSRAAARSDLLFALPLLIQHHVREAHRLAELPARSPSYEPAPPSPTTGYNERGSARVGVSPSSSPPVTSAAAGCGGSGGYDRRGLQPAARHAARVAEAAAHVSEAERHIHSLTALVGSAAAGDDPAGDGADALSTPVSQREQPGPHRRQKDGQGSRRYGGGDDAAAPPVDRHVGEFLRRMGREVADYKSVIAHQQQEQQRAHRW